MFEYPNQPNPNCFNHPLASFTVKSTCGKPTVGTQSSKHNLCMVIDSADGAISPSVANCESLIFPSALSSANICIGYE